MAVKKKRPASSPHAAHKLILQELENLLQPAAIPADWERLAAIPIRVLINMDTIPRDDMPMVFARLRGICEKSPIPLPMISAAAQTLHNRH